MGRNRPRPSALRAARGRRHPGQRRLRLLRIARGSPRRPARRVARRDAGLLPSYSRIVLETTGLAEPAPILHALFADQTLASRLSLAGVTTAGRRGQRRGDRGGATRKRAPDRARRSSRGDKSDLLPRANGGRGLPIWASRCALQSDRADSRRRGRRNSARRIFSACPARFRRRGSAASTDGRRMRRADVCLSQRPTGRPRRFRACSCRFSAR